MSYLQYLGKIPVVHYSNLVGTTVSIVTHEEERVLEVPGARFFESARNETMAPKKKKKKDDDWEDDAEAIAMEGGDSVAPPIAIAEDDDDDFGSTKPAKKVRCHC